MRSAKLGACDTSDLCSAILRGAEDSYQTDTPGDSPRVVLIVDGLTDSDAALLAEGAARCRVWAHSCACDNHGCAKILTDN